jgi:DNA-binding response OmpR family regulator
LHPEIRVLFTTSSEEEKGTPGDESMPVADYLRKPYTPVSLAAKARAALNGSGAKAGV